MAPFAVRDVRLIALLFIVSSLVLYLYQHRSSYYQMISASVPNQGQIQTFPLAPHPRYRWNKQLPPETLAWNKMRGFTVFKNLYIYNHTFYIVTTDPHSIPERRYMISKGLAINQVEANEPDESTLSIITPIEAKAMWGDWSSLIEGVTFMQTDGPQFLGHMYHFVVEIFALWHWRLYNSPDLDHLFPFPRPLPNRYVFPNCLRTSFVDHAGVNQWVLRASLPSLSLEFKEDWDVRMNQTRPFLFENVILGDRGAWHRVGQQWRRPAYVFPMAFRKDFWKPIRNLVTAFATSPEPVEVPTRPVITYISRQATGRRLKDEDHKKLIVALKDMAERENYELHIPVMEHLSKNEQIRILSRTTILLGVHGNGLSGQLWLPQTSRTTVIEIFFSGGFLYDYEYAARSLGFKYYGVWHDKYFTSPELPDDRGPEGFHGSSITVDASAVTGLIYRRLTLADPEQA